MPADRDLLLGLLALQTGLIDHTALMAAFHAWTRDKARSLADQLVALGYLDAAHRPLLEGLAAAHLARHAGDVERSLAAVPAGRSTRESLAGIGDADIAASIGRLGAASIQPGDDADCTASHGVGTTTSDGQRFRVLRPHARGGLGAVFVALDTELHREVALKQILDAHADDEASRCRFLVEAEITGGLEHPGIVPVYGLGTYGDGRPYYAMRFIRGDSLKEDIERFHADAVLRKDRGQRSLELRKLLRRFIDVCNAIDYAHSRGVLHRDIKPGNVIVGRHGETLVVDWGLAKPLGKVDFPNESGERTLIPSSASGSAETLPGSALGTPAYMSPEQAAGELDRLGRRSDVYSLGATLYCLLTGKAPFEGDVFDVLVKVRSGEFTPPRFLDPSVDRALQAVCLKAMAQRSQDRHASCRALADDIERWMADEPVEAWREPWTRALVRWLTRHRTGVTAAAAAVLVGVVGLVAVLAVQTSANRLLEAKNNDLRLSNTELHKQRLRALMAEGEAKKRADDLQKVADFQSQMLAQLDPSKAGLRLTGDVRGRFDAALMKAAVPNAERARQSEAFSNQWSRINATDVALELIDGTILKPAVEAIDKQFKDQPLVEAALRQSLAERYIDLGLYDSARPLLDQVLESRTRLLGDEHRDTLISMSRMGNLLKDMAKRDQALFYCRRALETSRRLYGEDDGLTLEAMGNMGALLVDMGKADEAAPYYHEALDRLHRLKGEDDPATLAAMKAMGLLLKTQGKLAEAETYHRDVYEKHRRLLGADHPRTISSLNDLGTILVDQGKAEEAAQCLREVLERRRRLLGEVHPDTLNVMNNLGNTLARAGNDVEAEALSR
jgi:serine/threonine protein kinase